MSPTYAKATRLSICYAGKRRAEGDWLRRCLSPLQAVPFALQAVPFALQAVPFACGGHETCTNLFNSRSEAAPAGGTRLNAASLSAADLPPGACCLGKRIRP